jgi:hypothetical protein
MSLALIVRLRREHGRPPFRDGKRVLPGKFLEQHAMVSKVSMKLLKQFDVDISR